MKSGRHSCCPILVRLAKKVLFPLLTSGVEDSGERTRLPVLALVPGHRELFPDWEGRLQSRPFAV